MLMGIKQTQEMIIQAARGRTIRLSSPMEYRNTLDRSPRFAGIKNVSRYFKEITPEQLAGGAAGGSPQKPNAEHGLCSGRGRQGPGGDRQDAHRRRVKITEMGLKDDRERDELDAKIAIEAGKLGVQGAELDQNAIQMAIDATRPEEEKSRPGERADPDAAYVPLHGPTGAPGRARAAGGTSGTRRATKRAYGAHRRGLLRPIAAAA